MFLRFLGSIYLLGNTIFLCFPDLAWAGGRVNTLMSWQLNTAAPALCSTLVTYVHTEIKRDGGQGKDKGPRQRIRQPKGMYILKYGHSLPLQPVEAYRRSAARGLRQKNINIMSAGSRGLGRSENFLHLGNT